VNRGERAAPVLAVFSLLGALACCLPLGFLGALGAAGAAALLAGFRPWLLGLSAALLAAGFFQLYRRGRVCTRRSPVSLAILWTAAVLVVAIWLFPQVIAGLLAG
jgi:hypothetical protein